MKFVLLSVQLVSLSMFLSSCAHEKKYPQDLSLDQNDFMNREALSIASKRLEEMVNVAKSKNSSVEYLASDLFLKANMSLLEGDYTTAAELFKHVVSLVPADQFVQKKYAVSLIRSGNLEISQSVLEKLYGDSRDEKIGLILAGVYTSVDLETKARDLYVQILKANPKNEDACIFLGKSFAMAKENEKAISKLSQCSAANPSNGMYDYYIGKIYLDMGLLPKAKQSFRSAFNRQPDLGQAVNALGILLEEGEQHDDAISLYESYLKRNPTDSTVLNSIVQALFLRERYQEVITYAERLSDLEPENLNLKVKLGILYTDTKKYSEAISVFKDLLESAPDSDKILYYLGAIHQEINNYQESIEYFNQIPATSGLYTDSSVQMANMLSALAQTEHQSGSGTRFKQEFLAFVSKKTGEFVDLRVEFSVIKAGYYEGTSQYKEAMETMMVVQDEKGFSIQHKYYLANLYEKEKRFTESTALIMGILETEPKNAHAWNFLGYSLLVRGTEMDKAFEYIQTALTINPEDGYIRDSLGWFYYKKGEIKKALVELKIALQKVPDDVEILKHLAVVHRELKDFSRAKVYLESALKHVRLQTDRQEILSSIEAIETDRVPASGTKD
ncbi:MAG TPA: tetratricopeptide repeat protein [Bacteriovoracaceae bacterium]|nr:tetratricopeptide repeat protein [Bacteriovoracaceae bacterium]